MTVRKLSGLTKFFWGFGQIGEGVKNAAFNSFLLFYYNQILGVSASLTSIALGIAVLCDALSDPIAGSVSDRFDSRWGRRHPFIVSSALPLAATLILLFMPPEGMSEMFYFFWVMFFAIAVRTFLTLYHIPNLALGAEMARDYNERTGLFSIGLIFSALGGYGFYFGIMSLVFPSREGLPHGLYYTPGYSTMAILAGIIVIISILSSAWGTRKEIPYLSKPSIGAPFSPGRIFGEMKIAFSNPSYRSIFFGLMLGTIVVAIEGAFAPFIGVHFWELQTESLRWIPVAVMLGLPFGTMIAPVVTRILDKKMSLIVSAALSIIVVNVMIVGRLLDLIPPNGDPLILPMLLGFTFLSSIVAPTLFITINSMFADIADEMELQTGERQEGVIYSARAFATKAANALGTILGGFALDLIAFPKSAPPGTVSPDVVFNLGLVQGPLTSLFTFTGLLLYLGYRLDRKRHNEILDALAQRKQAAAATAPEQA